MTSLEIRRENDASCASALACRTVLLMMAGRLGVLFNAISPLRRFVRRFPSTDAIFILFFFPAFCTSQWPVCGWLTEISPAIRPSFLFPFLTITAANAQEELRRLYYFMIITDVLLQMLLCSEARFFAERLIFTYRI